MVIVIETPYSVQFQRVLSVNANITGLNIRAKLETNWQSRNILDRKLMDCQSKASFTVKWNLVKYKVFVQLNDINTNKNCGNWKGVSFSASSILGNSIKTINTLHMEVPNENDKWPLKSLCYRCIKYRASWEFWMKFLFALTFEP